MKFRKAPLEPILARMARGAPLYYPTETWYVGPPLTILMSLIVAMLRTNRFTRTMAGPSEGDGQQFCVTFTFNCTIIKKAKKRKSKF